MTQENILQYGLRSVRYAGAKSWNKISCVIKHYSFKLSLEIKISSVLHQIPTIEYFVMSSQDYEIFTLGCSMFGYGMNGDGWRQSLLFSSQRERCCVAVFLVGHVAPSWAACGVNTKLI